MITNNLIIEFIINFISYFKIIKYNVRKHTYFF